MGKKYSLVFDAPAIAPASLATTLAATSIPASLADTAELDLEYRLPPLFALLGATALASTVAVVDGENGVVVPDGLVGQRVAAQPQVAAPAPASIADYTGINIAIQPNF